MQTTTYPHEIRLFHPQNGLPNSTLSYVCTSGPLLFLGFEYGSIYRVNYPDTVTFLCYIAPSIRAIVVTDNALWILAGSTGTIPSKTKGLWKYGTNSQSPILIREFNFPPLDLVYWGDVICLILFSGDIVIWNTNGSFQNTISIRPSTHDSVFFASCLWDEWLCYCLLNGRMALIKKLPVSGELTPYEIIPEPNPSIQISKTSIISDGTYLFVLQSDSSFYRYNKALECIQLIQSNKATIPTFGIDISPEKEDYTELQYGQNGVLYLYSPQYMEAMTETGSLYYPKLRDHKYQRLNTIFFWNGALMVWAVADEEMVDGAEMKLQDRFYQYSSISVWSKPMHRSFPPDIKNQIRQFVLIHRIGKTALSNIPMDVMYIIISFFSKWDMGVPGPSSFSPAAIYSETKKQIKSV